MGMRRQAAHILLYMYAPVGHVAPQIPGGFLPGRGAPTSRAMSAPPTRRDRPCLGSADGVQGWMADVSQRVAPARPTTPEPIL
jgi:hypothetical protein